MPGCQIVSLLTVSAVMLAVFFAVKRRAPEPIVPLSLFGNGIFAISALAMMLASMGLFGATLYYGLFVQGVLGQSVPDAGVLLTPMMLGVILSSIVSGQVVSRWGRYQIVAVVGMSMAAAGMFLREIPLRRAAVAGRVGAGSAHVALVAAE